MIIIGIYKVQVRKNAANAPSRLLQAVSSFCYEECFQPPTKYGKALRFLKLESSGQPTVKIWSF